MWERLALPQDAGAVTAGDRRPRDVVEQAFGQVGRRGEVLEPLLVLDPDGVEPEVVADPERGDVHLVLPCQLVLSELGGFVGAGPEGHAGRLQPGADRHGLLVADALHLGPQGAL